MTKLTKQYTYIYPTQYCRSIFFIPIPLLIWLDRILNLGPKSVKKINFVCFLNLRNIFPCTKDFSNNLFLFQFHWSGSCSDYTVDPDLQPCLLQHSFLHNYLFIFIGVNIVFLKWQCHDIFYLYLFFMNRTHLVSW